MFDFSEFKAFENDNLDMAYMAKFVFDWVEDCEKWRKCW